MRDCVIAADTDRSANSGSNATRFFLLMILLGPLVVACTPKDQSPKAKTLAAWKAMQKVGYDAQNNNPPSRPNLNDPPTLKPAIRSMRAKSQAFAHINRDSVDRILTDHLDHRVVLYAALADLLEDEYKEVVNVMRSFERDAKMRHLFTEMVTETNEEKAAGQFAELFVQTMADDDFAAKVAQIGEKYQPMMKELLEQASRVSSEETAAATSLSEKYHGVFKPNYYDGD